MALSGWEVHRQVRNKRERENMTARQNDRVLEDEGEKSRQIRVRLEMKLQKKVISVLL